MAYTDDELIFMAREALKNAYIPYSHYGVGACILSCDGRAFSGCNVENASYGLTICAERNALTTAITQGARHFSRIAIVSNGAMPWPCGACRQVLNEFSPDMVVVVEDGSGKRDSAILRDLLPHGFELESGV